MTTNPRNAVLMLVLCGACSGNITRQVGSQYVKTGTFGPNGGMLTVTASDDTTLQGTQIIIPPGALSAQTTIHIGVTNQPVVSSGALGPIIDFEPSGIAFATPATVTIPVTLGSTAPSHVGVMAVEPNGSSHDITAVTVASGGASSLATFQVSGFTHYGCHFESGDEDGGCTPQCGDGAACGSSDGCGGSCDQSCDGGTCMPQCDEDAGCGSSDGCGGTCNDNCDGGTCVPQCGDDAGCGSSDGCGGTCDQGCDGGTCYEVCDVDCVFVCDGGTCTPACSDEGACGYSDGCGGTCNQNCNDGGTCVPQCGEDAGCGSDDGCGGRTCTANCPGGGPCLVVNPTSLDFGHVGVNDAGVIQTSAAFIFSVSTQCPGTTTIQSMTVQSGSGDLVPQFSVPAGPPLPLTLTFGNPAEVYEMFCEPTTEGTHVGRLLISDGTLDTPLSLTCTSP